MPRQADSSLKFAAHERENCHFRRLAQRNLLVCASLQPANDRETDALVSHTVIEDVAGKPEL